MKPRWHQQQLGRSQRGINSNRALARLQKQEEAVQKPLVPATSRQPQRKLLECLRCTRRFSAEDVRRGNFRLETFICTACYAEMQQQPHSVCCFGKPTYTVTPHQRTRLYGYLPSARECRSLCPDREVCRLVVCGPPL